MSPGVQDFLLLIPIIGAFSFCAGVIFGEWRKGRERDAELDSILAAREREYRPVRDQNVIWPRYRSLDLEYGTEFGPADAALNITDEDIRKALEGLR